jgi:hypothetical protein
LLVFDIETTSLDPAHVLSLVDPFTPPPVPGEFDESAVKHGRTKDPEKRAAKVVEEREKHTALVENYATECSRLETEWREKTLADAALSPATGCILVIGIANPIDGKFATTESLSSEAECLEWFWSKYHKCRTTKPQPRLMIGHNIKQFDLRFLVIRSRILNVDVPREVFDAKWRKWDEIFVDTRDAWLMGLGWGQCESSLDHVGKSLGLGGKQRGPNGEDLGKVFGKLWREDRELARKYLHRDLELTARVAVRLGVC